MKLSRKLHGSGFAARYDDLEDVISLASSGVSLNSKDSEGRTALHVAAANGHLGIVEYLIRNGVDLNASDVEKNTPLHWACLNGHIEVVKNLILAGASVSILNRKMAPGELDGRVLDSQTLKPNESTTSTNHLGNLVSSFAQSSVKDDDDDDGVQVTCFTEDMNNATFHIQIIKLHKQIYAWIGCNSAKFGHLYAAAPTRPNNTVSVTSIIGGASDNTGSSIARRLALKSGLNIILACNIPKNSPMLEVDAERILVQKLISLGYTRSKSHLSPSMVVSAH